MLKKISNNVWKINADSNLYFLDFEEKIVIDTGNRFKRDILMNFFSKLIEPEKINRVIFTHLHYDHIGNADLFKNAKFFASKQEIKDLQENPELAVLDNDILGKFSLQLNVITNMNGLKIISTPGHTKGSICIYYPDEQILFSGDTYFGGDFSRQEDLCIGRTDLPTSVPEEMPKSLEKLKNLAFKILCPGHDYYKNHVL